MNGQWTSKDAVDLGTAAGGPCLGMWAYVRDRQWGVRLPKTLVKEDKLSKPQAMMKRKTGALEWGACQRQPALLGWRTAPGRWGGLAETLETGAGELWRDS